MFQIPIDVPIALPINGAPMLGQMEMDLHIVGALLVAGLIVGGCLMGWKMLHVSRPSLRASREEHSAADRRDLDQAA